MTSFVVFILIVLFLLLGLFISGIVRRYIFSVAFFLVLFNLAYLNINVKSDPIGLRHDGIEDNSKYEIILEKAGEQADKELNGPESKWNIYINGKTNKRMGYCHVYWPKKQWILLYKYHILWRSPGELNPGVIFD